MSNQQEVFEPKIAVEAVAIEIAKVAEENLLVDQPARGGSHHRTVSVVTGELPKLETQAQVETCKLIDANGNGNGSNHPVQ